MKMLLTVDLSDPSFNQTDTKSLSKECISELTRLLSIVIDEIKLGETNCIITDHNGKQVSRYDITDVLG